MVVHLKDQTLKQHQGGNIYHITCGNNSRHTYIGETKRTLSQRFKEHMNLDKPTGVGDHCLAIGHSVWLSTKLAQEKSEGGNLHHAERPHHESRPGIPPTHHLQPDYLPESQPQHKSAVREQDLQ